MRVTLLMRIVRFIIITLLLACGSTAAAQEGCGLLELPVSEDFDSYGSGGGALPPCWCASHNYDLGGVPGIAAAPGNTGAGNALYLYSGSITGSHYSIIITPELDITTTDSLYVKFRLYSSSTATRVEVGMCEDTGRYTRHFEAVDTLHVDQTGRWQEMVVDMSGYGGTGRHVAFRLQRTLQVGNSSCYIDNLRIENCGVTLPAVSLVGSTTMTVSWERYGAGTVSLEYNGTLMDSVEPPLTLTGLEPNTEYNISIGCDSGTRQQLTVTTMEGAGLFPAYYEPFSSSGTVPPGWRAPLDSRPQMTGGCLTMQTAGGDSCLAVLPMHDLPTSSELMMSLRVRSSGNTTLVAGVMDYAGEAGSFVAVDTLGGLTSDWVRRTVAFTPYGGEGRYIALKAKGSGTVYIDDLRVAHCMIDSVRLFNLTDTSVTVGWDTLMGVAWGTGEGTAPTVTLEWGAPGFSPGQGTVVAATSNPLTLTGLAEATTYDLLVTPDCGDSVCSYDRHSFTTFDHEVTVPYCTGFEETESDLPQGWVCSQGTALATSSAYHGLRGLRMNNATVTLPKVTVTPGDTVLIDFYGFSSGTIEAGYMANPYSLFTATDTLSGDGTWSHYVTALALPAGQLPALRCHGTWYIDGVALHRDAVDTATVSHLEQTSAHVAWRMLHGDSARLEYSAVASPIADFEAGTGTVLAVRDSITLDSLLPGTWYALHLQALSDSMGCQWQTFHFQTAAASIGLPFCENFDGMQSYPSNWRRVSALGEYPLLSNDRNRSPTNALRFSATQSAHTAAILPDIEDSSGYLILSFWANATHHHQGARLLVGWMDDITDLTTFHAVDSMTFSSSESWIHHRSKLGNTHRHVTLLLAGGSDEETRLFIDDICLEPCLAYGLGITADSTAATFRWSGYGVAGIEASFRNGQRTFKDTLLTSPARVQGLSSDTSYYITLKTICECGSRGGINASSTYGLLSYDTVYSTSINTHSSYSVTSSYCQTFEGISTGSMPSYWRRSGSGVSVSDRNYHNGGHSLISPNSRTLVMPPIRDVTQQMVSFYVYASNESALADSSLLLGVMRSPDSLNSFVALADLHPTHPGEWQRRWCDLSAYSDSGHFVALRLAAPDTCTFFIDDVSITSCGIGDASVDDNGVISWETLHPTQGVIVRYGPRGGAAGSLHTDTVTTLTDTMQNIVSGENYQINLTALCSNGANCIPTLLTFGSAEAIPYCENFESAPPAGMPSGWSVGRTFGGTPAIGNTANHTLHMAGHSSHLNRSIAVLPPLKATDSLQLSLSMRSSNNINARLAVGFIATDADPNTFTPIDILRNDEESQWQRHTTVTAIPSDKRLALCCFSVGQETAVWLDSLSVTHSVTPSIAVTSARTLLLTGSAGTWIEYGLAGFMQEEGTKAVIADSTLALNGLTPNDDYWFYIREDSGTLTCMPPLTIHMPQEEELPYCHGDTTFLQWQLPELNSDSINQLHLHLTLTGGSVAVGVMEMSGDWSHLVVVDTLSTPTGIRRSLHLPLAPYSGNGRFVGLHAIGGNASIEALTISTCPWVTAEMNDDGSITLRGYGDVEYGLGGFEPGSGTTLTINGSLTLTSLDADTSYDFYPYCSDGGLRCYNPVTLRTTHAEPLPYCDDFGDEWPVGWTTHSNAVSGNAIRLADNSAVLTPSNNRQLELKSPLFAESTVVVDLRVHLSGSAPVLTVCGDTVAVTPGSWQDARIRVQHPGRLTLAAGGNGTVKIRSIRVSSCALPRNFTVSRPGSGHLELNWDSADADSPFYISYHHAGNSTSTWLVADSAPILLPVLPDTVYQFQITCDSTLPYSCLDPVSIRTPQEPHALPYCQNFEDETIGSRPTGWNIIAGSGTVAVQNGSAYEGSRRLRVDNSGSDTYLVLPQMEADSLRRLNIMFFLQTQYRNRRVVLGAMRDAGDPDTFDSLTSFTTPTAAYSSCFHSLTNYYGYGRFLALKIPAGSGWVNLDHLSVGTHAAYNFSMVEAGTDNLTIQWEQQGEATVTVEYGPLGQPLGSGDTIVSSAPPCVITGLIPLTDYYFYISGIDSALPCRPPMTDTFYSFTPKGGTGCIDYTDLRASYVVCQYGSYANPTEHTGIVDYGYTSPVSRHTVHFDTTERDARTGGLLRTVPRGDLASVRLGNWTSSGTSNAEAECITYGMTVDSNLFHLLILRYAAVLQDPEHSAALQPRFRLQILNQNGEIIDSCSMADFIANPDLNWNQAANNVLWKDWTTVGLDLSAYSGQNIYIRLTTNDCGEGSHFGYAYFTLECAPKRMLSEGCSEVPNNRFTVPSGFSYRWYSNHDTATISDSSSLWLPSDNSTIYYCQLSFVDKPGCNFTMSAFAGARYPLALFDTALSVAGCQFTLQLSDRSTISGDGVNPIGTGEHCEDIKWFLPGGDTSIAGNATLSLTDTGTYGVTLVASIANGQCVDTLHRDIHIAYPYPAASIHGRTERCFDDPADLITVSGATSTEWGSNSFATTPAADTTITVVAIDTNGCHDTLQHTLVVHPTYLRSDSDSVCSSDGTYHWRDTTLAFNGNPVGSTINATLHRTTQHGCDSTMTLSLHLHPSFDIHHYDTVCVNHPHPFFDTTLAVTGDYTHPDTTLLGCDSIVTSHLTVHPVFLTPDPREVCDSLRWQDGLLYTADTAGVTRPLLSLHGCDSVIMLSLTVHPSYHTAERDSVCSSNRTLAWHDTLLRFTIEDDTLFATLPRHSQYGCDSITTLQLHLWPSYDIHHRDTTCDNLPFPFFDTTLASTGDYSHLGTTLLGCDSIVTSHLFVAPRAFTDDILVACDSLVWINHETYLRDTAGVKDTLATRFQCDSIVTLYLTVHYSTHDYTVDTFCENSQYLFRGRILETEGLFHDTIPTVEGCDSILSLNLTMLTTPQIRLSRITYCDTTLQGIAGVTDVPWHFWMLLSADSNRMHRMHDDTLWIETDKSLQYLFYADYDSIPHCPNTDTLRVKPIVLPHAELKVNPSVLKPPLYEYHAYDVGRGFHTRVWIVDDVVQSETSWYLYGTGDPERHDTTRVALVVDDGQCRDTAVALLPLVSHSIVAPNVFTPGEPTNNRFRIFAVGVLSGEVTIYDRHGTIVFHSDNYEEEWDGVGRNGVPCPMGNYVWHLRYNINSLPNSYHIETGSVLLIR